MEDKLNFEELKQQSTVEMHPAGPTIFKLTTLTTNKTLDVGEKRYPRYSVILSPGLYFRTLEDAEKKMRALIGKKDYEITLCYYIEEHPLCEEEYAALEYCWDECVTWRKYDANGNLVDRSVVSEVNIHQGTEFGRFKGRKEEDIHFEDGEIVEVFCRYTSEIQLMVVSYKVVTEERCREVYESWPGLIPLDASDDQYTVVIGRYDHDHVSPKYIFKPHFNIPQRTYDRLRKMYYTYYGIIGYINPAWLDKDYGLMLTDLQLAQFGEHFIVWVERQSSENKGFPVVRVNQDGKRRDCLKLPTFKVDRDNPKQVSGNEELSPELTEQIKAWIIKNYEILMAHWNGEICSEELTEKLCGS